MQIKPNEIASAIFGGFSLIEFAQPYIDQVVNYFKGEDGKFTSEDFFRVYRDALLKSLELFPAALNFLFTKLIPLTAGVIAVGVIVVVGGKVIGLVGGGLAALKGMGLAGKIAYYFGGLTLAALLGIAIRFAVRGFMFIWNFNWNVSDKQLEQQQQALITSLYGAAGEALGTALGTLCGTGVIELSKRFNVVKFNPVMMARIKEISSWGLFEDGKFNPNAEVPELYDEMVEGIGELLTLTKNQAARYVFLEAYKNTRRIIQAITRFSGVAAVFPEFAEKIERWGAEDSEAWSFAIAVEEVIENIDDERLQQFVEEFYESALDQCLESLMIVSYAFG